MLVFLAGSNFSEFSKRSRLKLLIEEPTQNVFT